MKSFKYLQVIYKLGESPMYAEALNALKRKKLSPNRAHDYLKSLKSEELIAGDLTAYGRISLTPKGVVRYIELSDDHTRNRIASVATIVGAAFSIIGFAAGLFVEYNNALLANLIN